MKDVWIRDSRMRSLLTSAIEVFNRETDGVFTAKFALREKYGKKKTFIYVENVYPFQTSERKPSEVTHGNMAAFMRVMESLTSFDIGFLGGYHSHPEPYRLARLSKSDVKFIRDELKFLRKSENFKTQNDWLELLLCIKKKRYARRQKIGCRFRRHGKKMKIYMMITPYTRYEILLGAYWVDFSKKKPEVSECKINIEKG